MEIQVSYLIWVISYRIILREEDNTEGNERLKKTERERRKYEKEKMRDKKGIRKESEMKDKRSRWVWKKNEW